MSQSHSPQYRVELSPRAMAEIQDICDGIAISSPLNARRFFDQLEAAIDDLRTMPSRHGAAAEARRYKKELRQAIVWPYRIVYQVLDREVRVHLVRHGARKPARDLELD